MARQGAGAYEVGWKFNLMRSFCGPPHYEAREDLLSSVLRRPGRT